MRSTFTVLVTVEHEPEAGHSASRIAEAVQYALEKDTLETAPFLSAQVDAFKGVRLTERTLTGTDLERYRRVLPLHGSK